MKFCSYQIVEFSLALKVKNRPRIKKLVSFFGGGGGGKGGRSFSFLLLEQK